LPDVVSSVFLEEVGRVIAGMMAETLFRETPPPNLDSYMQIRTRTIGIAPFLTLAEGSFSMTTKHESSPTLQELKALLSEIIGLQNDIVGLEKDLKENWPLNAVLVIESLKANLSDRDEEEEVLLIDSLKQVESMYGRSVEKAVWKWKEIEGGDGGCEREMSDAIVTFVARHLKWSMACQRYKTEKE